jgi:hypothetical protein
VALSVCVGEESAALKLSREALKNRRPAFLKLVR